MEIHEERVASVFIIPFTLLFVGIFLFIGLLNGQKELILLTFLLLCFAVGTRLWTGFCLKNLTCDVFLEKERVFPDETFRLNILLTNDKILPVYLKVLLSLESSVIPALNRNDITRESSLLWYQKISFPWELKAEKRGLYPVGPRHIIVGDLFGFFKKEKLQDIPDIIVYPRLVSLRPFSVLRKDLFGVPGAKSPVKDPIYILGTIDYQQGQPVRNIHWKASARHNKLQQKIFDPSEQGRVILLIDVKGFVDENAEEAFEETIETAASLAIELDRHGCAIGLGTNGNVSGGSSVLPVAKNNRQIPALLETLARLQFQCDDDLDSVLRRMSLSRGETCILFTFESDENAKKTMQILSHRKIPVSMIVNRLSQIDYEQDREYSSRVYSLKDLRLGEGA